MSNKTVPVSASVVGSVSVLLLLVFAFAFASISISAASVTTVSASGKVTKSPYNLVTATDYISTAKAVKLPKAMNANFKDAGKKAGLQIWRIENFEPVPYPESDYGKFYSGDSYIVLNTKQNDKAFSWDIHFWLGNETSQDEAGSAAILAVELDDGLGGAPVQYREVQEHETDLFLSYFKNGIRYLPGGVASGFVHAEINADGDKKLYQVKGKRNVRVTQVAVSVKSMNKGDCFILDSGKEIFVYVGEKAKGTERLKAVSAANQIRDQDHKGRSHVSVIDSSSDEVELEKFFKELGSGSQKEVADASATDDDEAFEKKQDSIVTLYKVSDASGKLSVDKIKSGKKLTKSDLKTDDCFILDTVTSGIYVWIGKKGTSQEKVESIKNAQNFLKLNNYPTWTQVTRVVEGGEPAAFNEYFSD